MSSEHIWARPPIETDGLFLATETEQIPVTEPWWSRGKALHLDFRPAPRIQFDDDDDEEDY